MPTTKPVATQTPESVVEGTVQSELAKELVASGAAPVSVDIDSLVKQIQELQATQAKLLAERGIPADPIAAQIQALKDHLTVQANANPVHKESYTKALSYVDGLDSKSLTSDQAQKAVLLVNRIQAKHPQHELAYSRDLAEGLFPDDD